MKHLNGGNKTLQKMKAVMRIVEKMAREKNVGIEKKCDWDCAKVTKM